jgi:phosphate transport system substrate-binding protein
MRFEAFTYEVPGLRLIMAAALTLLPLASSTAGTVRVGGTGAGLAAMQLIGERVAIVHPDIQTEVLPSLGTQGGLRALGENAIQIAIALRTLTPAERDSGLREAACATTALALVSSRPQPQSLTRAQLPALYENPAPVWSDGAPLRIILRSRDGSENPFLARAVPGLETALAAAYRHPGMPVGASDQENADLAQRTEGSLAIMTLLQMRTEKLKLNPVALDGVIPSPETLLNGRYPMPIRLCLVLPANPGSDATRFIAYVKSPPGQALLRGFGAEPAE